MHSHAFLKLERYSWPFQLSRGSFQRFRKLASRALRAPWPARARFLVSNAGQNCFQKHEAKLVFDRSHAKVSSLNWKYSVRLTCRKYVCRITCTWCLGSRENDDDSRRCTSPISRNETLQDLQARCPYNLHAQAHFLILTVTLSARTRKHGAETVTRLAARDKCLNNWLARLLKQSIYCSLWRNFPLPSGPLASSIPSVSGSAR